jgi:hypothetical protein
MATNPFDPASPTPAESLLRRFRRFSLISAGAMLLLISLGLSAILDHYTIRQAEEDAKALGQAVIFTDILPLLQPTADGGSALKVPAERLPDFARNVNRICSAFGVVKIKLFDRNRRILYSSDAAIIGLLDTENPALERALKGEVVSKLEHKEQVWDLAEEERIDLDLVETYLPLSQGEGIAGVFELYLDVSRYRAESRLALRAATLVVGLVLAVVFGVLHFFMQRTAHLLSARTREVKVLSGLLPICSSCKKIRNDQQHWEPLEQYISGHSESQFTHSLCPDCLEQLWQEQSPP